MSEEKVRLEDRKPELMILKMEQEDGSYKFVLATDEVIGSIKQDITKDVLFFINEERKKTAEKIFKEMDKEFNIGYENICIIKEQWIPFKKKWVEND